jgi:hypothetical protein
LSRSSEDRSRLVPVKPDAADAAKIPALGIGLITSIRVFQLEVEKAGAVEGGVEGDGIPVSAASCRVRNQYQVPLSCGEIIRTATVLPVSLSNQKFLRSLALAATAPSACGKAERAQDRFNVAGHGVLLFCTACRCCSVGGRRPNPSCLSQAALLSTN